MKKFRLTNMIWHQVIDRVSTFIKKTKGYTLLEVMIVVALLGILAAIAMTGYQTYMVRVRIAQGLVILEDFKHKINEFYAMNRRWPTQIADLGYTPDQQYPGHGGVMVKVSHPYYDAVGCHNSFDCSQLHLRIIGKDPIGIPEWLYGDAWSPFLIAIEGPSSITWVCSPSAKGQTSQRVPIKYLPAGCRNLVASDNKITEY